MATVSTTGGMTLIEQANRTGPNGGLVPVINVLSKTNRLHLYAQWEQCNNGTIHHYVQRSTEPTGTWRDYDQGVDAATATTTPFDEPTAMLDHIFTVDKARLRHAPDPDMFLEQELRMEMSGLQKQAMTAIFYGDRDADASYAGKIIRGISKRSDYNTLSSDYVYDNAGGNASVTANKTSIYLFSFGPRKVNFIYPRGDAPGDTNIPDPDVEGLGIRMKTLKSDLGEDGNGKKFPALNIWFEHHFGVCVEDPRYVARICNISTTNIDESDDFSFNEDYFIDALTDMPDTEGLVAACNKHVMAQVWKRVKDSSQRMFTEGTDAFGDPVAKVCGVPLVKCDAIVSTEDQVT